MAKIESVKPFLGTSQRVDADVPTFNPEVNVKSFPNPNVI